MGIYYYEKSKAMDDNSLGQYETYRLALRDEMGEVVCAQNDISTDEETAKAIVGALNNYRASPVHFREVLEDFLS